MKIRVMPRTIQAWLLLAGIPLAIIVSQCVAQPLDYRMEFSQAESAFLSGSFQEALLHYREFLRLLPQSCPGFDESLMLGKLREAECYYYMKDEVSARLALSNYIQKFPGSPYLPAVKGYLQAMQDERDTRRNDEAQRRQDLQREIARWQAQLAGSGSAYQNFMLFDLYWKAGDYGKACQHLQQAIQLDPAYASMNEVKSRVVVDRNTQQIVPRDPSLDPRRQVIEDQLVVRNINPYQQSYLDLLGTENTYIVTGEVYNDGIFPVDGVSLTVSILDMYENIINTQTVSIGDMNAFESRPFRVNFGGFSDDDGISNVRKVKVQPLMNSVVR